MDIIFDIETLGTAADCATYQIGGVALDETGNEIAALLIELNPEAVISAGFTWDRSTIDWHLHRAGILTSEAWDLDRCLDALRDSGVIARIGVDPVSAAFTLLGWINVLFDTHSPDSTLWWSRGTDFDFPRLQRLLESAGLTAPWHYYQLRDLRTLTAALDVKLDGTTPHHALLDAHREAKELRLCKSRIQAIYDLEIDCSTAITIPETITI